MKLFNGSMNRSGLFAAPAEGYGAFSGTPFKICLLLIFLSLLYQIYSEVWWSKNSLLNQICDDAYISLVYARNFFDGNGLVYNVGERVEGYTNFLWVILMSLPFTVEADPVVFIKAVGCLSNMALVLLFFFLAKQHLSLLAALLACISIAVHQSIAYMAVWGLETVFYLSLYVLSILLFFRERFFISGLAFSLAGLTRMEILVVFSSFLGWLILSSKRERILEITSFLTGFCILFIPYYTWRYIYYGYVLPNTFYAKAFGGGDSFLLLIKRGLNYLVRELDHLNIFAIFLIAVLSYALLWLYFIFFKVDGKYLVLKNEIDRPETQIFLSVLLYLFYIVWVGGDIFNERFIIHVLPLITLWVIIVGARFDNILSLRSGILSTATALYFITSSLTSSPIYPVSTHLTGWISLGKILKANHEKEHSNMILATDAAGALKFYSEMRVLDILGLNDIHIAHKKIILGHGDAGHEKQDNSYILETLPDYISTWIDPDGGAGRGFKKWFQFRQWYDLSMLLDTSSTNISDKRVISARNLSKCELQYLYRRDKRPVYDWGLWKRRKIPYQTVDLVSDDFFSANGATLADCEGKYIVKMNEKKSGTFLYGPYMTLPRGTFAVKYYTELFQCESNDSRALNVDVYNGTKILGNYAVQSDSSKFIAKIVFKNEELEKEKNFEFRAYSYGVCYIKINKISISELN